MINNQFNPSTFAEAVTELRLPPLPDRIVDSHGISMDVSGGIWEFNDPVIDSKFDFDRTQIVNPWLLYSVKRYVIYCLRRVSPRESYNTIRLIKNLMERAPSWDNLRTATTVTEHAEAVGRVMTETLERLRREGLLDRFFRLRAWYSWSADYLPELGFDADEAYQWEQIRIPGNEKGVAVRTDDPESGPLSDAELIVLRRALQLDQSMNAEHVNQRAALWLCLVYGRNPANYIQLRRSDFQDAHVSGSSISILRIPRIKKRTKPRTLFTEEYVDIALASVLKELLACNAGDANQIAGDLPIFKRNLPRSSLLRTQMETWAWHLTTGDFSSLIRRAVERYALISPRTGKPMHVTPRRLRYTFATNRVREGISARDLAEALDHSDLQHVRVYFDAKSTIVERLDRAAAKEIAPKLALFRGRIVKNDSAATNTGNPEKRIFVGPEMIGPDHHLNDLGSCRKGNFCDLHPPYSCYPCDRFEPFSDSLEVHERVFDFLVDRRERLRTDPLESSRIAIQLDEVIYACAEVVLSMRGERSCDESR